MADPIDKALTKGQVQRLAFIKYLLSLARNQAKQPEPMACSSILVYHDAIELFLQLSCERLNVKTNEREQFLDYWDHLNLALKPRELPSRESMKKFNKSRVALKHHGTMPSRLELNDFSEMIERFFLDAVPLV